MKEEKKEEGKKIYKCSNCGYESTILTLGEINCGCLECGDRDGFRQYANEDTEFLRKFLM
jgi:DNA-directed RNA polymerase subunit RPC12/RpoP